MKQINFWERLTKPFFCSAPMSGVTDSAFRAMLAKYAKPDVIFTEFISCDGLCSKNNKKILTQLKYQENQRPIVVQLFGATPKNFYLSAQFCQNFGFDGIDINMGCPDKSVLKQKAGSSLIKNYGLVEKIIRATKQGAPQLPLSVKTRIGYSQSDEASSWFDFLLRQGLAALTIHGRTKAQGYQGKSDWQKIALAKIRAKKIAPSVLIIGNGDIESLEEARVMAQRCRLDGIMIGRALLRDPFLFNKFLSINQFTPSERMNFLLEHCCLFERFYQNKHNFSELKKFFKAYLSNFKQASAVRNRLMLTASYQEFKEIVHQEKAKLALKENSNQL